jgi:hypothetical protein
MSPRGLARARFFIPRTPYHLQLSCYGTPPGVNEPCCALGHVTRFLSPLSILKMPLG